MKLKKSLDYYYKSSKKFLAEEKLSESLKLSREGILFYPHSTELCLLASLVQIKLGNFAFAKDELRKLYKKIPDDADLLCSLCEVYLNLGKKHKADFYAQKAIALYGNRPVILEHIALDYAKHKFYKTAVDCFKKALKLSPSNAYFCLGIGVCLDCMGETKKAIHYLNRAIQLKRNFCEALNYLANVHYDQNKIASAMKLFESIAPSSHIDPIAIKRILSQYEGKEKNKQKIGELKKRLETLLGNTDIHTFMSRLEKKTDSKLSKIPKQKVFLEIPAKNILTHCQKTHLYDINRYLAELFKKPLVVDFNTLPELKSVNQNYIEKTMSVFKLYADSFAVEGKQKKLWGFEFINFYLMSIFKFIYDNKI
jgi:Flp pilus assembly protein TadD